MDPNVVLPATLISWRSTTVCGGANARSKSVRYGIQAATDAAKAAEPADDQPELEGLQAVPEGDSPEATEAPNGENPAG